MHKILFAVMLLVLSSCATQWVSDTKPPALLERDLSKCKIYSYDKFPPDMYNVEEVRYRTINSSTQSRINSQNASQTKTINVPYIEKVAKDANQVPRGYAFNECMRENGWYSK